MKIIRMSSKGQVIIPKSLRSAHYWNTGQELVAIDTLNGILLKPKAAFAQTDITDVAGCLAYTGEPKSLAYTGEPKSLAEMESAVARGMSEEFS